MKTNKNKQKIRTKNLGVQKKVNFWNLGSLIVPLIKFEFENSFAHMLLV